jgi:fibronectin type 3 domain-containing protein
MNTRLLKQTAAALLVAIMAVAGCKKDEPVRVSSVSLNTPALELTEGESATLAATIAPGDAENKTVTWTSSNPSTATVDQSGKVTAAGAGTATITVTTHDGSKTATATVNVKRPFVAVTEIKAEGDLTVVAGGSLPLAYSGLPDNATNKGPIEWSIVSGHATGATITQHVEDGITRSHFNTLFAGEVTVRGTIRNGKGEGADYTQDFKITVTALPAGTKTAAVGAQAGIPTAGTAGSVAYAVTTAGIENGSYDATVANLPAGVTVGNGGKVTLSNGAGTLTLNTSAATPAGEYQNLTLAINGATSAAFRLTVAPAGTKTVTVGAQQGIPTAGTAGSITYAVTTAGIENGDYEATVLNLSDGVTVGNGGIVTISSGAGTLTLNTSATTPANEYWITLAINGATSAAFELNVNRFAAPTGLTATAVSTSQIKLSWNEVPGASGYTVERCKVPTHSFQLPIWTTVSSLTANSYEDGNLNGKQTYEYRVYAYNAAGNGIRSATVKATTLSTAEPTNLRAVAISNTEINLSWDHVSSSSLGLTYRVERSLNGSDWTFVGSSGRWNGYNDTGLSPGTTYYYRVRASENSVTSDPSNVASATTPLSAPVISGAHISGTQISVVWSEVTGATAYSLEMSLDGKEGWHEVASSVGIKNIMATVFDLSGGTQYYFRVRAVNAVSFSPYSDVKSYATPLLYITGFTGEFYGGNKGWSVDWDAYPGAVKYYVSMYYTAQAWDDPQSWIESSWIDTIEGPGTGIMPSNYSTVLGAIRIEVTALDAKGKSISKMTTFSDTP